MLLSVVVCLLSCRRTPGTGSGGPAGRNAAVEVQHEFLKAAVRVFASIQRDVPDISEQDGATGAEALARAVVREFEDALKMTEAEATTFLEGGRLDGRCIMERIEDEIAQMSKQDIAMPDFLEKMVHEVDAGRITDVVELELVARVAAGWRKSCERGKDGKDGGSP